MVHQYKLNGYNIVIDVYSGAVHVVDDVAYDIIRLFCDEINVRGETEVKALLEDKETANRIAGKINEIEEYKDLDKAEVLECLEDLAELHSQGKLFAEDSFRINAGALKERHTDIKALCLHVSHACDLTCSYCFAGQGRFNGPAALMSEEVGRRAIDFLVEKSGTRRNLEVDFFGGEPLLNFETVKNIVKYARSLESSTGKNFRFTLTTNGMGITDEVIDFANRECHNVVLSLDGRREVHDRERCASGSKILDAFGREVAVPKGAGSYEYIVPKFQRMVAARTGKDCGEAKVSDLPADMTKGPETGNTNYYIRGTFTHYNPDFTEDIFHMTDLGFSELSMEPVVCNPESPFALTEEDKPILMEQYEILAKEMLKRKSFVFYHYMLDLGHGPCIYKRISGCGSGTEYFAVTPQGELYPCHQFVGDPKYLMGDIWKGVENQAASREFKSCNVYAREECDDCWAKLYCSGGCAANAYHATGDILGVYDYGCELFRKRIECAIMMNVAEAESRGEL